ncbi:hypothetical protein SNE40_017101 [Patella caerulea]|uniref:Cadherin domain-containing protein n=1 Tax=Patella caerulea TaxID=87958 RepID=A0AAN8JD79_PATCE
MVNGADLTYKIPEEQPVNTFIGNILNDTANVRNVVSDEDYSKLRLSFLTEGNAVTSLFGLDEKTGELSVGSKSTLDRETICPFSVNCVVSLDVVIQSPLNQFFRKVSVNVILDDVNDNPPRFPSDSVSLDVSEAVLVGASIPLEGASDRDKGKNNSLQTYEIVPSDGAFGVSFRKNLDGTSYLNLVVKKELDHETTNRYSLQIVAKDGGVPPLQGIMKVEVTVTDVNDNLPKFNKDSYSVNVDENVSQNSVILTVEATDKDSGDNGDITYKLSSHQDQKILNLFSIDPRTGAMVVTGDLQGEATERYDVIVEASDHALQPFTSQIVVTVTVRDVINSSPKLTVNILSGASISEYASLGAAVAHVAVKDSDRGRNGIVTCKLQNQIYFDLQGFDVDEYKVIVAKQLDSEVTHQQNVTIICEDAGTPPLTANSTFVIKVIDENDNAPTFMQMRYSANITENNKMGQSILTVTAHDLDSGTNGEVRYSLASDSSGQFLISPEDGVIMANTRFDYETHKYVNFTILAIDQGKPQKTATAKVAVKILDINDEPPKFSQDIFTVPVSEVARPGELVSIISAMDFESGVNGELEYYFVNKTPSIPFTLLRNGSVILDESLDYEKKSVYEFRVMAVDKGTPPLNATARVIVQVKDINDNVPIITFPNVSNYLVNVTFADTTGTVISRIRVTDYDSGLNGQIHYVITARNDSGRFDINSKTGEIFTTRNYDMDDINMYRLIVSVQDKGSPPLAKHTTLLIKLTKGNGTAAAAHVLGNEQNILITLTIVCVTIVLSATIVLIIVIMRRRDRKREGTNSRQTNGNNETGKYDDPIKSNNINEMKSNMADDGDFGFPVPSDTSSVLQNPSCLDNKTKSSNQYKDNSMSPNSLNLKLDSSGRQESNNMDQLAALQLHHALLQNYKQSQGSSNHWPRQGNVADDVNSDASGETTTSDSGRGGSEEDITSHNGTQTFDEHDLSRDMQISNSSFQSQGNVSSHSNASNQPVKSSVKDPVRNSSRKHVTFREASALKNNPAGTVLPSQRNASQPQREIDSYNKVSDWRKPNILYAHQPHNNLNNNHRTQQNGGANAQRSSNGRFPPNGVDPSYKNSANRTDDKYLKKGHYIPMGNNKVLSHSDYIPMTGGIAHHRDWRNDSVLTMTTEDGDDRSTTTSGSYTIENEDRFAGLDYGDWKDVVV